MTEEKTTHSVMEIHNLTKCYGKKKVLDNISFSVKRGEIMGFLGPNGAGKSTTMNIITGYIAASSGKVSVEGMDTKEKPLETKKKIGYLPEIPPLYTDMTVLEYLVFVYELKGVKMKRDAHLRKIMEQVRIFDVHNRIIKNLSKGYKQRVGLAQALIGDPDILILDEPTVGLDPKQIMEIRDVISEIGREKTVILSTHILQEVMAVCDRYTIIHRGKVVASGSMNEFSGGASGNYRLRVKEKRENAQTIAEKIEGVTVVKNIGSFEKGTADIILISKPGCDVREAIFNTFAKEQCPILSFSSAVRSLEEVFMQAISDVASETEGISLNDEEVKE